MTSTNDLSGLKRICAALAIERNLFLFLLTHLAPLWYKAHPRQRLGRPPLPFSKLLAGTLQYMRDASTYSRSAAVAGFSAGKLHAVYEEITELIGGLGLCQADGTLLQPEKLQAWLIEMKASGETVLLDGTFTRCPRPGSSWQDQKPFYDSKHDCHAMNTLVLTTEAGDMLAVHGGWPGAITEADQLRYAHFAPALYSSAVATVTDRGFRAAREEFGVLCAKGNVKTPKPGDAEITRARAENERPNSLLKSWRILDRIRSRKVVRTHFITCQAVAALVMLNTYGHRRADWPGDVQT